MAGLIETSTAIYLSLLLPAVGVIINLVLRQSDNLRDTLTFLVALSTFFTVIIILSNQGSETSEAFVLIFRAQIVRYTYL